MRLAKQTIRNLIAKTREAIQPSELPKMAVRYDDLVYRVGDETMTLEEFAEYEAEWNGRGLPVMVVSCTGEEARAAGMRFIEGRGVAHLGPRLSPEEWEKKSIECHAKSNSEAEAAVIPGYGQNCPKVTLA